MSLSRREFVRSAAGVAAVGLGGGVAAVSQNAPQPNAAQRGPGGPAIVGSANILQPSNKVMELLKQGKDPLEAVIVGINIVEDDPNDHSVGYGGLPNEDGVVELDSSVMHGPLHKAGAVAALHNIRNPSSVARLVMLRSDHVLLVGEGALKFAKAHGFKEQDLLTDEARRIWLDWKEKHSDKDDWLPPEADKEAARWKAEEGKNWTHGTVNCCALTASGDLAGCTSTSGLAYKLPGRVGDSPIIGAGLYVDNEVGAAGSTGRGEANLQNCSSFLVVEFMRNGLTPEEACLKVLKRIADKCEKRLRNAKGEPEFGLSLYAIRKDGAVGGANLHGGAKMAYHDGKEAKLLAIPALFKE